MLPLSKNRAPRPEVSDKPKFFISIWVSRSSLLGLLSFGHILFVCSLAPKLVRLDQKSLISPNIFSNNLPIEKGIGGRFLLS